MNFKFSKFIGTTTLFLLGILSAGFGLKGFLLPNFFIDGGVTGISLIISGMTDVPLSILLLLVNLPFMVLGYTQIGLKFALKSSLAIVGLSISVHFFSFPIVTTDKLLVAAFGGFFLGAGIGLSIRGGAVLDGTEVLAIYLSKKTGAKIGEFILFFNILIFGAGAYFMSVETALYAVLTYTSASKAIDFILHGLDENTGVTIISPKSDEIKLMITNLLGRGVTIYSGKGGYDGGTQNPANLEILFTVLSRLEVAKLEEEVKCIDPTAFMVMSAIRETRGGITRKSQTS